jgi:hypothetical protein
MGWSQGSTVALLMGYIGKTVSAENANIKYNETFLMNIECLVVTLLQCDTTQPQLTCHAVGFLQNVTFDVRVALSTNITVLWDVTPWSLVGRYEPFGATLSFLLHCIKQSDLYKPPVISNAIHGALLCAACAIFWVPVSIWLYIVLFGLILLEDNGKIRNQH